MGASLALTAPKTPPSNAMRRSTILVSSSRHWLVLMAPNFVARGTACPPPLVPAWRMLQQQAEMEPRNVAGEALRLIKLVLDPPPVPLSGLSRSTSVGLKRKAAEPAPPPAPRGPGGLFAKAMQDAVPGSDDRLSKRMRGQSAPSAHVKEPTPPLVARIEIDRTEGARSAPPSLLKRMLGSTPFSPAASKAAPTGNGNGH